MRPTKLTPEVAERIIQATRLGASYAAAAEAGGVERHTISRWVAKGEAEEEGEFYDFSTKMRSAQAELGVEYLDAI